MLVIKLIYILQFRRRDFLAWIQEMITNFTRSHINKTHTHIVHVRQDQVEVYVRMLQISQHIPHITDATETRH